MAVGASTTPPCARRSIGYWRRSVACRDILYRRCRLSATGVARMPGPGMSGARMPGPGSGGRRTAGPSRRGAHQGTCSPPHPSRSPSAFSPTLSRGSERPRGRLRAYPGPPAASPAAGPCSPGGHRRRPDARAGERGPADCWSLATRGPPGHVLAAPSVEIPLGTFTDPVSWQRKAEGAPARVPGPPAASPAAGPCSPGGHRRRPVLAPRPRSRQRVPVSWGRGNSLMIGPGQ
jgi:hypothetical protein